MMTVAANSQTVELLLEPEKNCNDRSYCVDILLQKSNLAGGSLAIGTSSILLTYDQEVLVFKDYTSLNFDDVNSCNGWMPQQADGISRMGEVDITLVLAQNGNACPVIDSDPVLVGKVCFDIIQQGGSPNIRFDLAHTQLNTNDLDDGSQIVGIGGAGHIDAKNILVCDCPGSGEPCDDGNVYTVNDRYDVYCHCLGEYEDADQDGIWDGVDPCLDLTYQAEDAELFDVAFRNNMAQYTGTGFIDFLHNNNDFIEFTVNAPLDADYELAFRYALETGNRPLKLLIDDIEVVASLDFPATGNWFVWEDIVLNHSFTAGTHTVKLLAIGSSGANFDKLTLSYCTGCAETGQACDDGNPCTTDDVIDAQCNCGGKYEDTDFDGVCNVEDACEGYDDSKDLDNDGIPDGCDDCDNALIGTPCDDGDPCTMNDKYIADCQCVGTFTGLDSDNDGVCDAYDECPGGNDALDADGDGIPDDCDTCDDRLIGTPCDDGDPCTLLDIVTPNCGCNGFFFDSDSDGVCTTLDQCEGFDDFIDTDGDRNARPL